MSNTPYATEQLIVRARAGEETAFAELLGQLGPRLRQIERKVESFKLRSDATQVWDDTLSQAWRQFADFPGTSVRELNDWLEKTVLDLIRSSTKTEAGNLDTIAPGPNRDQQTIVSAPTTGERPTKADIPSPIPGDSDASAPDPSSATTRDANLGTVSDRPAERDARESDLPEIPATMPLAAKSDATNADPLKTIAPIGDTSAGGDPLATIVIGTPNDPVAPRTNKIFGDYEILETIARGGMGVVYKACHIKLNRVVALKMILSGQFANSDDIERFHAEAEAAARLSHPNIVGIHDSGQSEGQHFISMQFVEGQSLADLVREHPLQPRAAAKYMAAISEAMQYAHDHGILHRDLKPANVLVDKNNVPLVTDFGLAKLNPNDAMGDTQSRAGNSQMTMDGTVMGTASYMPPEQALGKLEEVSAQSDVYSLGATLYDLLTGKPPFGAANIHETIRQVIEAEPVAPRVLNANVPKDLETICLKCLQKLPARRYASAQELAEELQRYRAGEPILARPVGFVERTIRWCYRNPGPTTAICASVCGLIVATVLWQTAVHAKGIAREAQLIAQEKQKEAEASRSHLLAAINELFTTWGNVTILNEPALADVREQLLAAATKLYEDITEHLRDDPELQQELGVSYYRLADMMFQMKGYREAAAAVHSALEIQQLAELENVSDQVQLKNLGETLTLRGNIMVKLGRNLRYASEGLDPLADAVESYEEAIRVRTRLVKIVPTELEHQRQLLNSRMNKCMVQQVKGDRSANRGEELNSQVFELEDKQELDEADRIRKLVAKQYAQAEEQYLEAQAQFDIVQKDRKQLLERAPEAASSRHDLIRDLAKGSYNLANITIWLENFDLATQHVENAAGDFELVLSDHPDNLEDQLDLARCHELAGDILSDRIRLFLDPKPDDPVPDASVPMIQNQYARARQHYTKAINILKTLDSSSPAIVTKYRVALGSLLPRIGDLHFMLSNDDESRKSFQSAIDIMQPLVDAHPDSRPMRNLLSNAFGGLADLEAFQAVEPETPAPESTDQE